MSTETVSEFLYGPQSFSRSYYMLQTGSILPSPTLRVLLGLALFTLFLSDPVISERVRFLLSGALVPWPGGFWCQEDAGGKRR